MDETTTNTESSYRIQGSHLVDGIRYLKETSPEHLEKIKDFEVADGDIYLCGYPKSGNAWMSTIIRAIFSANNLDAFEKTPIFHNDGQLDYNFSTASKKPHPGFFWTHVHYNRLPRDFSRKGGKIIYIARDPKDVAVSFFYFHHVFFSYGPWTGSWDVFFDAFISGNVVYGSWFDHLSSFWIHRSAKNIFFVRYEDLKQNCSVWIRKLADFLQKPVDEMTADKIAGIVDFDHMKDNSNLMMKNDPLLLPGSEYLRKGVVGDWKTLFSVTQKKMMDQLLEKFAEKYTCTMYD